MSKAVLWLGLSVVVIGVAVVTLVALLFLGVFNLVLPPAPQFVPNYTGVWSSFIITTGAKCQVYDSTTIPYQGFSTTGTVPPCVALNRVAAIKTQRTCEAAECLDLTATVRPRGYVEMVYQDCDQPLDCATTPPACFPTISSCSRLGYSLVDVQQAGHCLERTDIPTLVTGVTAVTNPVCAGQRVRSQQFNVSTPRPNVYSIRDLDTSRCLNVANDDTVVMGPCSADGWYQTEETTAVLRYTGVDGPAMARVTVPSQLIHVDTLTETIPPLPADYLDIVTKYTAVYDSLQGNRVAPFIAGCSSVPLPVGAPALPLCVETHFQPTATLPL